MAQYTKYSGNITGQAGSLTTALDAALNVGQGWTITYTAASKRVYRAAGGNQFYFRVDDSGAGTGGAKEALIRGAESWTDIDTPVNPFPTAAQSALTANSLVCRKSASADATNRPYVIFADTRTFYIGISTGDVAGAYFAAGFGDGYTKHADDVYLTFCIGRTTENSAVATGDNLDRVAAYSSTTAGHFAARAYTGIGTSWAFGKHGDAVYGNATYLYGIMQYPNGPDSGLYLSNVWVHDGTNYNVRGWFRGFYEIVHPIASFSDGDVFQGTGTLAGRAFYIMKQTANGGIYCFETSDTLDTN